MPSRRCGPGLAVIGQIAGTGYDVFLFGVAYYSEQWAESDWEPDARRMRDSGVSAAAPAAFRLDAFDDRVLTRERRGETSPNLKR